MPNGNGNAKRIGGNLISYLIMAALTIDIGSEFLQGFF